MFGSLKPSDRSSGLRSFGLSEADHSGILSGSRPMQQRLVCVEAGQTFSIQRMEVLTPQVSSIHCRLTRGRSLVRNQPGPPQLLSPVDVGLNIATPASGPVRVGWVSGHGARPSLLECRLSRSPRSAVPPESPRSACFLLRSAAMPAAAKSAAPVMLAVVRRETRGSDAMGILTVCQTAVQSRRFFSCMASSAERRERSATSNIPPR